MIPTSLHSFFQLTRTSFADLEFACHSSADGLLPCAAAVLQSPLVQFSTHLLHKAAARMAMRSSAATSEMKLGVHDGGSSKGNKRRRAAEEEEEEADDSEDEQQQGG